jgi:hypothetical protein
MSIRAEIARNLLTRGGAPLVRVTIPPRTWEGPQSARPVEFVVTPEELWELIEALLELASAGLFRMTRP